MLIDARSLAPDERLEADICIVGAGPAGITLALELLGSGCRSCVLESGGRDPEHDALDLAGGESVGYPYFHLRDTCVRAFGGTSRHWREGEGEFWHAVPLDAIDFEERCGVPHSGWPFTRTELVPFYRRAESICGLEPFDYDEPEPLSSRVEGVGDRLVVRRIQVARPAFVQTLDRVASDSNTQLVLHATASELIPGGTGRVAEVRALTAPGRGLSVAARIFVLAGGGIENPRLLLSSTRGNERGLGNGEDLVGRFFQEHAGVGSGIVDPCDEHLLHMPELTWREGTLYTREGAAGPTQYRLPITLAEETTRAEGLLNVAFFLEARSRASVARGMQSLLTLRGAKLVEPRPSERLWHLAAIVRDAPNIARAVRAKYLGGSSEQVLLMQMVGEQLPDPGSRVTLADSRDGLGRRRPRLDWHVSRQELDSVRRAQDIFDECLAAAGLGRVRDRMGDSKPLPLVSGHYHHIGTTRMHADPRQGVVDADGRVHGIGNLYITGSSVFPTGGWANPTLTIVALAARLAHHLRGVLGPP